MSREFLVLFAKMKHVKVMMTVLVNAVIIVFAVRMNSMNQHVRRMVFLLGRLC